MKTWIKFIINLLVALIDIINDPNETINTNTKNDEK